MFGTQKNTDKISKAFGVRQKTLADIYTATV